MIDKTENEIMSTWKDRRALPVVTIRSITYNHADYISEALDSFLSQITTFGFEIIIHDDASTDGTSDIIRTYARKYPNIIIPIIQKENQYSKSIEGITNAINPIIHGKYVALCEGDDYWIDPLKLEKQISYMESHPECSMTIHAVNYVQNGRVYKVDRISEKERDISIKEIIEGGGMFCATPSICCKTDLFLDNPRWRLMSTVGDYPLQILASICGSVHFFPEVMGAYRYMTSGSWSDRQKSSDIANKRRLNEIQWLQEMNLETGFKYDKIVKNRIGFYAPILYKSNAIDLKTAKKFISDMQTSRDKYIYYLSIFKNALVKRLNKR